MAAKSLHAQLIDGLTVKSRKDGSVHTVKDAEGKTVAEVCVGTKKTRLNLRRAPKTTPKNIELGGKSKSWPGGGVNVDDSNLAACRAILSSLVATSAPKPAAAAPKKTARKRQPVAA
jgi:hypothetical protein